MSLKTIAETLGVSVSTVSKALSGSEEIGEQTAQAVVEIASKQGYLSPRMRKRMVRKQADSPIIAVICPDMLSNFYANILVKMEEKIKELGGFMVIGSSNFLPDQEMRLINYFSDQDVDGIVLIQGAESIACNFRDIGTPVVVTGTHMRRMDTDFIRIDDCGGVHDAIQYLAGLGHEVIGYLGETLTWKRMEFFEQAMAASKLPVDRSLVYVSAQRYEQAGYEGMRAFLQAEKPPTAVFAAYDHIALGAIRAIDEAGLHVPESISIIGMDDIASSSYLQKNLTTVRTHTDALSSIALRILFSKIKEPSNDAVQSVEIQTELVIRDTTMPPTTALREVSV